ncbi:hypothetical protein ABIA16_003836 [Sinorhizobium fredii]
MSSVRHPNPNEWFTGTREPPDPYDWSLVVKAAGLFAAVLLIADLLF